MNSNRTYKTTLRLTLAFGLAMLITWGVIQISAPAVAANPTELFISEYIEGSSNNKAIEIYNGTGTDITFTGQYTLALYTNGSSSVSQDIALTGSIVNGDVFVIAHGSAGTEIQNKTDQTSSSVINFNGNDAVALFKNGAIVDVIGQIGTDPGSEWGSDDTSTEDNTLVRKISVIAGDTDGSDAFDPADEWDGYAKDTFTYLGNHVCGTNFLISKSAPGNVAPGEVFTYTLTVENATGVTPTTTTITDVLPADVDFIIASHGGGLDAGNVISWTVSDFASGATLTRTFRVTATGTNDIKNVDYGVNGGSEWPTTTLGTTVTTQLIAGLHVTKVGPDLVAPNEAFTYTLTVDNQTGGTLTDLVISDTLPMSATYASSTPMGNWDAPAHTITWTAASLAHDTTLTYTLVVTAPDATTTLTNDDYVAYATEWTTPTRGMPATTLIHNCNSIYGIQYVPDPGTDDASPCEGQDVTVTGIVYGVYDEGYFIAESAGPWHGVYVADANKPAIGDEVEISGEVYEHFGLTEIKSLSSYTVQSQGNETYASTLVTTTQIPYNDTATSEAYEGVFVETRDITVTATESHNIWAFTDSSVGTAKADDWGYDADPAVGDTYAVLRGALAYDFDEYKVMPRNANDVVEQQLLLGKSAPANVSPGALYTYTLTVGNYTGGPLTDVVLTDTVPANTTFAYASGDGAPIQNGSVVSWTVDTLAYFDSFTAYFAVTATTDSVLVTNNDYMVSAANYPTPTMGTSVTTLVGDEISIHHIQGDGLISPLLGQDVTGVDGIVTSVHAEGFYMQEPDADANPLTSEGIYVYLNITPTISVGDIVDVDGTVDEYYESTQIENPTVTDTGSNGTIPATQVTFPETVDGEIERYEGMLVTIPHTMTVAQNYFQGRYGQVTLSTDGRMYQPTHMYEPGSAEYEALLDENMRRMLILDDGSSEQNPAPIPYIGLNHTLRAGDVVSANLTGIIDNGPINSSSPPAVDYRLHPTEDVNIDRANSRPELAPDVGGRLQVASFNVLNYFNGDGMGGGFPTSRGADTPEEFERQRSKIITAVLALDADVVGLMEIENDGYDANSAIADLVDGLNEIAGSGTYTYVNPGVSQIGTDEIAVGMIYQPGSVTPVGDAAILDNSFDADYIETKNRPALAQTFEENTTGEKFTAVVNHLKSKGSPCDDVGDPNTGDGQGNCNLTRTDAMSVEVSWLETDPTGSGDPDFIILGDLNSYAQEDPIDVARNAGYTDLLWSYAGPTAYSYIFDGQSGYLDYALSNSSLTAQVTGAAAWHINADEPSVIDYNVEFKSQDFYTTSAYRASDHDPVIIGLDLGYDLYLPLVFHNGN